MMDINAALASRYHGLHLGCNGWEVVDAWVCAPGVNSVGELG